MNKRLSKKGKAPTIYRAPQGRTKTVIPRGLKIKKRAKPVNQRPHVRKKYRLTITPHQSSRSHRLGKRAGKTDAAKYSIEHEPFQKKVLNGYWMKHLPSFNIKRAPWKHYADAAKGYVHGYFKAKGQPPHDWLLVPTNKSIAAIITVKNEEDTIGAILRQLNRLPLDEVFVIVNGSSDRSFDITRNVSHAVVVSYPQAVGHDVGRAIGANLAQSDILLFLDGDIPIQAEKLIPFIYGIENGLDVALNDVTPYLSSFARSDSVTYMKQFLNVALKRPDLAANSMTAVPHALSRKTVKTIGFHPLIVPPKAQVLASMNGLKIGIGGCINVINRNKLREGNVGMKNNTADLIIGDHIEAIKLATEQSGARLDFVDTQRKRAYAGGQRHADDKHYHP
ncbi:glycosyltransferase family A protein [Paenibacillus sp. RC67]|uniref:glycosyltransferase family 2 protein n=1 Tax=Paenibacillus sp. RC67 TaxID=3039392 RepID=UPI0024AD1C2A|nr:glycosyltransferase family A protein [Paenibacillus sp. RC67]